MDDEPKSHISINGIDVSRFIDDVQFPAFDEDAASEALGLRRTSPITITGCFDDGTVLCASCGQRFTPATSTPTAQVAVNGVPLGWVCDACAIAAINFAP